MKEKKGLQKFTHYSQIENYEQLQKLPQQQINELVDQMNKECNEAYTAGEGKKFDRIVKKMLSLMTENEGKEFRNFIWQNNHGKILICIHNFINNHNIFPTIECIIEETKLSKPTVYKHLKEFDISEIYADHWKMFNYMEIQVMAKLFKFAIAGDVKAAKLYFDRLGSLPKSSTPNNYIQINNFIINQKSLEALPEERKKQIIELIMI